MPKFAANLTMMFNEVPFMARFAAAAAAGFTAVEYLFPYEFDAQEVALALRDNKLQNVLFNLPPGDWSQGERGMAALPGREIEFRESLVQALHYAGVCGTPQLHVMSGIVPAGVDPAQCHTTLIDNLRAACALAAKHHISLLIEPINTRDMPGYFLSRQDQAHAICAEVCAANLKVQMDFYHAQIMEGDIATTLRRYVDNVGHIQIAGVPGRHEPDHGELNYPWLFDLLDSLEYQGFVGCEYRPRGSTLEGLGWLRSQLRRN